MTNNSLRLSATCGAVLLCSFFAAPAEAQLVGKIAVGVSVVKFEPASDGLTSKVRVVPTISRVPRKGWGLVGALNWVEADVDGDFVGISRQLGRVNVRPFMGGVGYTATAGAFSIQPSIVAGPAWNRLEVDDDLTSTFAVRAGDDDFNDQAESVTFAVRPGVSATYAFAPRFGVTAFAGYLFNRPKFDVLAPTGDARVPWKTDGLSVSGGVVVSLFK